MSHPVHALHEGALDDIDGTRVLQQGLAEVFLQMVRHPFLQGRDETRLHVLCASSGSLSLLRRTMCRAFLGSRLLLQELLGQGYECLTGLLGRMQHDLLDDLELVLRYVAVHHLGRRIHDGEVHSMPACMIEEYRVHGLADIVVATEREGEVAHPTAHVGSGQVFLDPPHGTYEVCRIRIMLRHTCGHGQHVGVEDDVGGKESHLLDQQAIGTLAHGNATLEGCGLSFLVEGYDDHCRS